MAPPRSPSAAPLAARTVRIVALVLRACDAATGRLHVGNVVASAR